MVYSVCPNTHKAVDMICIVNDGANLTLRTNQNWSKNISTSSHKPINLQTASDLAAYLITVFMFNRIGLFLHCRETAGWTSVKTHEIPFSQSSKTSLGLI